MLGMISLGIGFARVFALLGLAAPPVAGTVLDLSLVVDPDHARPPGMRHEENNGPA